MKKRVCSSDEIEVVTYDNVQDILYEIIDLNGSETILDAFIAYMTTDQLVDYTDTLIREGYKD